MLFMIFVIVAAIGISGLFPQFHRQFAELLLETIGKIAC
jgi:hypothetical protein